MNRRLYRSRREEMIGGVAGGVAEYFDLDPTIVRVAWAFLALVSGGVFFILYIVMWVVVPVAPPTPGEPDAATSAGGPPALNEWIGGRARRIGRHSDGGSWVFGLVLIGVGAYFLARQYLPRFGVDRLWPLGLVVLGVLLVLVAMRRRPS